MRVLLIEDNEDDVQLIREALCEHTTDRCLLHWADTLESGCALLTHTAVDAMLIDLSLPDSHGLETLDLMRARRPDAPIIVLTGLDDEAIAEGALLRGAQDYLVKGRLTSDALRRAIRYAIGRHQAEQALRKSEERFHLACRATNDAIWDWDLRTGIVWWNDAYELVFGYRLIEQGEPVALWAERIHPEPPDHPGRDRRRHARRGAALERRLPISSRGRHLCRRHRPPLRHPRRIRRAETHDRRHERRVRSAGSGHVSTRAPRRQPGVG